VPQLDTGDGPQCSRTTRADCPQCGGQLAVMRVIGGREADYWTLRCVRCGGIHLEVVKTTLPRTND
jgi:uncharacterized Zn finger protein